MESKRLICVEVDNKKTGVKQSNKYYNMTEIGDGNFKVEYGRVGGNMSSRVYPMSMWDSQLRKKLKKYEDITHLHTEEVKVESQTDTSISNKVIAEFFNSLQTYAGKSVSENYRISASKVTQRMVDKAQEILDTLSLSLSRDGDAKDVNAQLLELYKTIPRKMNNVKAFLINDLSTERNFNEAGKLLKNEQDTLDTMVGQVILHEAEETDTGTDENILEKLGLTIEVASPDEHRNIEKGLGQNAHRLIKAYKVDNNKTSGKFKENIKKSRNKSTDTFFHGSRNQNWFNILQTGLLIRPSGAIHTGSMYGDGLYGANKAQKAIGYSSMRGSYWTGGSSSKGFIGIFEFHTGKQKKLKRHDSSCYSLNRKKLEKDGYDSVYAMGGIDLRNDEFIVYDTSQATIRYVLEMRN